MKIKIGNNIYDSNIEPIMLIFESDIERNSVTTHISDMKDGTTKYVQYPKEMNIYEVKQFMKLE